MKPCPYCGAAEGHILGCTNAASPTSASNPLPEAGTVKLTDANIYDAYNMCVARIAELDAEVARLKDDNDILSEHLALSVKDVNKLLKKRRKVRRKVLKELRAVVASTSVAIDSSSEFTDGFYKMRSYAVAKIDDMIEEQNGNE